MNFSQDLLTKRINFLNIRSILMCKNLHAFWTFQHNLYSDFYGSFDRLEKVLNGILTTSYILFPFTELEYESCCHWQWNDNRDKNRYNLSRTMESCFVYYPLTLTRRKTLICPNLYVKKKKLCFLENKPRFFSISQTVFKKSSILSEE